MAVKVENSESVNSINGHNLSDGGERRLGIVLASGEWGGSDDLLSWFLWRKGRFNVVGRAKNLEEALAFAFAPGLEAMVVDMARLERSVEIVRGVKAKNRSLKLVVRLPQTDARAVRIVWAAGADAYVGREALPEDVEGAIQQAFQGAFFMKEISESSLRQDRFGASAEIAKQLDDETLLKTLSGRELCVLRLLGQNFRRREIAERLGVSLRTVDTYRNRLMTKAGFRSGTDLWRLAKRVAEEAEKAERRIEQAVEGASDGGKSETR